MRGDSWDTSYEFKIILILSLAAALLAGSAQAQTLRDFCAERPGW